MCSSQPRATLPTSAATKGQWVYCDARILSRARTYMSKYSTLRGFATRGMITSAGQADTVIRAGQADLVLMAREFLREMLFSPPTPPSN